jgi:hypothetical protein
MDSAGGVAVNAGGFGGFKVEGAGTDGGRAMKDFGHADSGDVGHGGFQG